VEECSTRALLRPRTSAKAYLEAVWSGERRRRLRRHEERLAEHGAVDYAVLDTGGNVEAWLDDFLRLEAGGWKGREGTALRCQEDDRRFFHAALADAFRRGRLLMLALRLDGRPVALLCDLLCEQEAFVFKLAFDEAYAAFSPGVLLELEQIRRVHGRPELRWVDSCNGPGPSLLKDLWADRRLIQTVVVASGKAPGPFILAVLPLLRWLRRKAVGLLRRVGSRGQSRPEAR
jgi:CelD/BcsL family acetyltransferase involved in cellulose biosynthesis